MQRHESRFVVDAPPDRVWRTMHPRPAAGAPSPRVIEYQHGRIEILHEGDEAGQGLVRICEFRVPRLLGTGGRARSWEVVSEARQNEISHYTAVSKPLWSRAEGWHTLEDLGDGRTLLTFVETYHAFNRVVRRTLEAWVHRFISHDNDAMFEAALRQCGTVTRLAPTDAAPASAPPGAVAQGT